ncbi:MAG: UDP-galactopyranose mutase [Kouleothrix sp.]|jgi:UDP-galactopyranose mutase|nr:UDP-galactopyranose mutase [Kouleothrix sp.]
MPLYDYLVVGAGLFGATFAQQAVKSEKRVMVVERRDHVAGNCFDALVGGIQVHRYGPHIFHTSDLRIWQYVNRFADFKSYWHTVQAVTRAGVLGLPISLHTLNMLHGIATPARAQAYFERVRDPSATGDSAEAWCLRTIGRELYELLIEPYTVKQWGCSPRELPASIVKRLPIRMTWDNSYFSDQYQGIPIDGYTRMVELMLSSTDVYLNVDFLANRDALRKVARKVVYSGQVDSLFGCDEGKLPYRSIRIEQEVLPIPDFQGTAQMNYPTPDVPWTRITEPKHFVGGKQPHTVICKEFSGSDGEPAYPIGTHDNTALAQAYIKRAEAEGYIVGGRLGRYQYLDMHQAIGMALSMAKKELVA